jgi:signal transduction histidine kinase
MLFYAADRAIDPKPANPNDTILEVIELLEENARSQGVVLKSALDPNMVPVPLDRHALYRAILNLTTNAIDACVESEHGNTVTLKSVIQQDSVLITVQDNGVGIPQELLRRITERFFTTKPSKGTGLGLPVVQKIAELHGGRLEVESVLGQGSSFHLRLPRQGGRA